MDRSALINEVAHRTYFWNQRELVQALVSCLTPLEACETLVPLGLRNQIFRHYLLRKIGRDMKVGGFLPCQAQLVTDLMAAFSSLDYNGKQTCGYCLSSIYDYLPGYLQQQLILFFLRSEHIVARRRAYKILRKNWHTSYEAEVSSVWAKHQDTECALLVVAQFPDPFLLQHADELERALNKHADAGKLYLRLGEVDVDKVRPLEQRDPITFAYIMTKLGIVFTEDKAMELFEKSKYDDRIGLLIWCFGQMGLWTTLNHIVDRSDELQKGKAARLRAQYGLSSQ